MDEKEPTNESDKEWTICCSHSSKEAIKFFAQYSIMFSILMFSFIEISKPDTESREIFFSLIGSILGVILPSPKIK